MAPNTSHIQICSHTQTIGPPLRVDLTMPPLLSAGVRPDQTGPLCREHRRAEAVLLSRRREGGRLPVVSPCRSFWEWCHTHTNPHPHTSLLLGSWHHAEVEKEQHSHDWAAGLTVTDELILANIQARGESDPWRLSCLHEVTLWAQIYTQQQHTGSQT